MVNPLFSWAILPLFTHFKRGPRLPCGLGNQPHWRRQCNSGSLSRVADTPRFIHGDFWWFLEWFLEWFMVIPGVIHGDSWWIWVIYGELWWFIGDLWWFMVIYATMWWFMMLLNDDFRYSLLTSEIIIQSRPEHRKNWHHHQLVYVYIYNCI